MKINVPYREQIVVVIVYLYIMLFVYAALTKILDFENFQNQLGQSPMLSNFAEWIAVIVPAVELVIAFLLMIKKYRTIGLIGAYGLMLSFSCYIYIILHYSDFVPCSCGGILEKMTWMQHLIFNIVFLLLSIISLILNSKPVQFTKGNDDTERRRITIITLLVTFLSITIIAILYFKSRAALAQENPFIRRYVPASIYHVQDLDLGTYGFYFAGGNSEKIYLGHSNSPLSVVEIGGNLQKRIDHEIRLEREDLPFRSTQVKVENLFFYFLDGTVPVIYKGSTNDWTAKIIMDANHYFSKTQIITPFEIAYITQDRESKENVVGKFSLLDSIKTNFSANILQKQIDGIFDTDGMLFYNKSKNMLLYIYFYRNQYTLFDTELKVIGRRNTIDTTKFARIKPQFTNKTGARKMGSQPYVVNSQAAVHGNLLFIHSTVKGKLQDPITWDRASSIDVYDFIKNEYVSSFYIYHNQKDKITGFFLTDNSLYVISGRNITRYRLGRYLLSKL